MFVQSVTGSGSTLTLNGVGARNLLTLQSSIFRNTSTGGTAESTPTDSNGTVEVAIAPTTSVWHSGVDDTGAAIFFVKNANSGTHTLTPENAPSKHRTLAEWAGALSSPFDVSASGTTSASAHTSRTTGSTSATAQDANLVLIAHAVGAATGAADIGYTDPVDGFTTLQKVVNDASDLGTFHAWRQISVGGVQSATFNWTSSESDMGSQAVIAVFKMVPTGGTQRQIDLRRPRRKGNSINGWLNPKAWW